MNKTKNKRRTCPNLITTIPYTGDILLEDEELLLKFSRQKNIKALIALSGSVVEEEFEVTNTTPTKRISSLERK